MPSRRRFQRRTTYDRTLCKLQCSKANPLGICHCSNCKGEKHGSHRVTPQHIFDLADKKLHDPKITAAEERFWLDLMSLVLRHANIRKVA